MKALYNYVAGLRGCIAAMRTASGTTGGGAQADMGFAMLDSFLAEVDALARESESDLPAKPAAEVDISDEGRRQLFGQTFVKRVADLSDLCSAAVNQLSIAARKQCQNQPTSEKPTQAGASFVLAHAARLTADALLRQACALEQMTEALQSLLLASRYAHLGLTMPTN